MPRNWFLINSAIILYIFDYAFTNAATDTPMVAKRFEADGVIPDLLLRAPTEVVAVEYPNGVSVDLGNVLTPTQVKNIPIVKWNADPKYFYTISMTDLDLPSGTEGKKSEFNHWLVGNVPGNDVEAGDVIYEYLGSGPPQGTGQHRYVFLIFKQPRKIVFDTSVLNNESLISRGTFKIIELVKKYNLGDPVAGNFYKAEYDDYVPEFYKQLKEKYNL